MDGEYSSDYDAELSCTHTDDAVGTDGAWWRLQLPREVMVTRVVLYNRASPNPQRLNGAQVFLSSAAERYGFVLFVLFVLCSVSFSQLFLEFEIVNPWTTDSPWLTDNTLRNVCVQRERAAKGRAAVRERSHCRS